MELFMLVLSGVGATNLVVNASILDMPRDLLKWMLNSVIEDFGTNMLGCMMCSGFWVGIAMSQYLMPEYSPIFSGFLISVASNLYDRLSYFMDTHSGYKAALMEE